ncbi:MAG: ATP-binding protein [Candidatus Kapaibacterium sp.]
MITELKITNFRSLREVWLDNLQPVNLLIGPNNSGKSNILKALKFFSEFLGGNMPGKEELQSLFFRVVQERDQIESAPISLQFLSNLHDEDTPIGYGAVLLSHHKNNAQYPDFAVVYGKSKEKPGRQPITDVESLDREFEHFAAYYFDEPETIVLPNTVFEKVVSEGNYTAQVYEKYFGTRNLKSGMPDPKTGFYRTPAQKQIFAPLENLKIYRPEPSKLLDLYPIQNEQSVNEDAGNLVAFLQVMRNRYQYIFDRITNDLRRFVPEFTSISFDLVDEPPKDLREKYNNKSLAKIGLTDKFGRIFWADSLSEGTLYFLSLLCIIHQPEPPKLLLLEEPEKGIHPRRIRETMDLIFELAAEKNIQVILTTHSTAVVDTFADIPEAVYIVERVAQQTIVKNLQRDVIEPHNEQFKAAGEEPIRFTDALGEHWAMGFLGGVPE